MASKVNKKNKSAAVEPIFEKITFEGSGKTPLPAIIWLPEGEIKAVLQLTHGMTEHIGRYSALAEVLSQNGIALAGFDLRGHGQNKGRSKVSSLGEGGWEKSLEDMHLFYEYLKNRFEDIPHFMLGFSLGSFLLREYFSLYNDSVSGAIIMGSGYQGNLSLNWAKSIIKKEIKKSGFDNTTPLIKKLSFETYNKKFSPNKTPVDWLCSDEKQLKLYRADPLCASDISSGLFLQLVQSMKKCGSKKAYRNWNKDMSVLLLSGEDDPVGNFGKGSFIIRSLMMKGKMTDVALKTYPNARHDILHEEKLGVAFDVRSDIVSFILSNIESEK